MSLIKRSGKVDSKSRSFSRQVSLDLPLSKDLFEQLFRDYVDVSEKSNKMKMRAKIQVTAMCKILGIPSLIYTQQKSSTQHRILGDECILPT